MLGNSHCIEYFQRHIDNDSLHHNYLLFGPPYIGKATFARAVAHALESGKDMAASTALLFSDPSSVGQYRDALIVAQREPGIDDVRRIRSFCAVRPVISTRRTVIIEHADGMTPHAQHALLKLSEDAAESALIILVARSSESMLATIRSRSSGIYCKKPAHEAFVRWAENALKSESAQARERIIRISGGFPGLVQRMHSHAAFRKELFAMAQTIADSDIANLFRLADRFAQLWYGDEEDDNAEEAALSAERHVLLDAIYILCMREVAARADATCRARVAYRVGSLYGSNAHARLQLESAFALMAER